MDTKLNDQIVNEITHILLVWMSRLRNHTTITVILHIKL